MRKEWFKWYVKELTKTKEWAMFRDRFLCPCCFMPTFEERAGYDICPICFWEDDGQDSDDADIERGGPNSNYSLREARANFVEFGTMYRNSDTRSFEQQNKTKSLRMSLYDAYVRAIVSNDDKDWINAISLDEQYGGE